jgi:hypothetical protein
MKKILTEAVAVGNVSVSSVAPIDSQRVLKRELFPRIIIAIKLSQLALLGQQAEAASEAAKAAKRSADLTAALNRSLCGSLQSCAERGWPLLES